jgi:hypothetical protein
LPYGYNQYAEQHPNLERLKVLVGMSIDSLSQNGKLIAVLPYGILFFFRGGSETVVKRKVDSRGTIRILIILLPEY